MKKNSFFNKTLYFFNSIFAFVLLISYLLPYISPKSVTIISVFSLLVPVLIIVNGIFLVYWLLRLKKYFMLSATILAIGLFFISPLYKFSEKKILLNDDLKIMSYNVRLFNIYKWNKNKETTQNIVDFIKKNNPDILTVQEYYKHPKVALNYPYKYIKLKYKNNKFGLAIYSKYPIINAGSLNFKHTSNDAVFADIVTKKDTIRVYNVHLESLKINPKKENFGTKDSEHLINTISYAFKKQVEQVKQLLDHEKSWNKETIICGDFNNTAYSWVYKQVYKDRKDAFIEAGKGFGKSFNYPFPVRIDFIFTSPNANINQFKTFDVKYSDHFPIMARLNWDN